MALQEDFKKAVEAVRKLSTRPSNEELLELYGLYKQATEGDVKGSKPLLDLKGRRKWEAWDKLKGMTADVAQKRYVSFVQALQSK